MGTESDKADLELELRSALGRLLSSSTFSRSPKISRLLAYLVEETVAGRSECLKETTIAIEVFDQPVDFNPRSNPIVRVNASRLRNLLRLYYSDAGRLEPLQIQLAPVGYVPEFRRVESIPEIEIEQAKPVSSPAIAAISHDHRASASAAETWAAQNVEAMFRKPAANGTHGRRPLGIVADAAAQGRGNWFRGTLGAPASVALVIVNLVIAILFAALHNSASAGKTTSASGAEGLTIKSVSDAGSFLLLCRREEAGAVKSGPLNKTIAINVHGKIVICEPILQSASMVVSDGH